MMQKQITLGIILLVLLLVVTNLFSLVKLRQIDLQYKAVKAEYVELEASYIDLVRAYHEVLEYSEQFER